MPRRYVRNSQDAINLLADSMTKLYKGVMTSQDAYAIEKLVKCYVKLQEHLLDKELLESVRKNVKIMRGENKETFRRLKVIVDRDLKLKQKDYKKRKKFLDRYQYSGDYDGIDNDDLLSTPKY